MPVQRRNLDSVSGQALPPSALAALSAAGSRIFALPTGVHHEAAATRALLDTARASLAARWQVPTASITAVNNLANAFRLAFERLEAQHRVAVSPLSRQGALSALSARGAQVTQLAVDAMGHVTPNIGNQVFDAVVVQAGNQEVGTIDDVAALQAEFGGATCIVDATEWVGRMDGLPAGDVIIVRAGSWGGPMSVCFVVHRSQPLVLSPTQRQMLSPDPLMVIAAVTALESLDPTTQNSHRTAIDQLRLGLLTIADVEVHGDPISRLPHIVSFSALHVDGEALAVELDRRGYAVGSGSACVSESGKPSHVLAAMGRLTHGNVRVSLAWDVAADDVTSFTDDVRAAIHAVRTAAGVADL